MLHQMALHRDVHLEPVLQPAALCSDVRLPLHIACQI